MKRFFLNTTALCAKGSADPAIINAIATEALPNDDLCVLVGKERHVKPIGKLLTAAFAATGKGITITDIRPETATQQPTDRNDIWFGDAPSCGKTNARVFPLTESGIYRAFNDTSIMDDFQLVMHVLAQQVDEAKRPTYVTVASWFSLWEMVHRGLEDDYNIIKHNNIVDDYWYRADDGQRQVYGFRDTPEGLEALKIMDGWLGLEAIWKLGEDGTYHPFELTDNPHRLDLSNPMEMQAAIVDAIALVNNRNGLGPRKPKPKDSDPYDHGLPF